MSEIGRLADVKAMTKLSRPTIDRLEKAGDFRHPDPARRSRPTTLGTQQDQLVGARGAASMSLLATAQATLR
jgi:hypothetical protein